MKKLYKFEARWERTEQLTGIFVATEDEVRAAMKYEGYLDEPLGRHSSGEFSLAPAHIKVLTEDQAFIEQAIAYKLVPTGVHPFYALKCDRCGDVRPPPFEACGHKQCGWKRGDAP